VTGNDFIDALGEDDQGQYVWISICLRCGAEFEHMTYPEQDVINRRQDHVHLEEPDFLSILRWTGHPGGDSDTVLRAIGVPEEML
jgi:hypothetical protein